MISSKYVADDALPCTNKTGMPFCGPLNKTRVVSRSVVMARAVIPGSVGIEDINKRSLSRKFRVFICQTNQMITQIGHLVQDHGKNVTCGLQCSFAADSCAIISTPLVSGARHADLVAQYARIYEPQSRANRSTR